MRFGLGGFGASAPSASGFSGLWVSGRMLIVSSGWKVERLRGFGGLRVGFRV